MTCCEKEMREVLGVGRLGAAPAVLIKPDQIPLSAARLQAAAAPCKADKLENMNNISHYPPTSIRGVLQLLTQLQLASSLICLIIIKTKRVILFTLSNLLLCFANRLN